MIVRCICALGLWVSGFAANPLPFINGPLTPDTVAPGSPGFELTVNGSGFVSDSSVLWNGSPRQTTYLNGQRVMASISASDITAAGTFSIAVQNPGTELSNVVLFEVGGLLPGLAFVPTVPNVPFDFSPFATVELNGDGKLDLVGLNAPGLAVVILGNGDGTFQNATTYAAGPSPSTVQTADFNNDGKLDMLVLSEFGTDGSHGSVSILLGNGDGTFQAAQTFAAGVFPTNVAVGDFNRDGKADVAVLNGDSGGAVAILLGNGDGTLQPANDLLAPSDGGGLICADLNRDGNLDLVAAGLQFPSTTLPGLHIFLGNGDGTFSSAAFVSTKQFVRDLQSADLNGDGIPDLVAMTPQHFMVMLGKGDGTFQMQQARFLDASSDYGYIGLADFNNDGKIDLLAEPYTGKFELLLGNNDGTFARDQAFPSRDSGNFGTPPVLGDFNTDGPIDIYVNTTLYTQTSARLSAPSVDFGSQAQGFKSKEQRVSLLNVGFPALNVGAVQITGVNAGDFSFVSECGTTLASGASCPIHLSFTPSTTSPEQATLQVNDGALGSPQTVALSGTGIAPFAYLIITSQNCCFLDYFTVGLGQRSPGQRVKLQAVSNGPDITFTSPTFIGANPGDFVILSNTCSGPIQNNDTCQVTVAFQPVAAGARSASLEISNSSVSNPVEFMLSGTGTAALLSATKVAFPAQAVGTTSAPQTVTLTNSSTVPLNIFTIVLSGHTPGDYAQTNNCPASLAAGATCSIMITFTPTTNGERVATLTLTDSDATSPQKIYLNGSGT